LKFKGCNRIGLTSVEASEESKKNGSFGICGCKDKMSFTLGQSELLELMRDKELKYQIMQTASGKHMSDSLIFLFVSVKFTFSAAV
jgi:hypothetical protein